MPKGVHKNRPRASRQHRWNSGSQVGSTGHVKTRVGREHPLADPNGYAYEHILVWVSAGNQRPAKGEVLHHINEEKTDNRIENLRLMSKADHSQMHGGAISDAEVKALREAYAAGKADMKALADQYNIPLARVSKMIRGESRIKAGGPISTDNRGKSRAGRLLDGVEHNGFPGEVQ